MQDDIEGMEDTFKKCVEVAENSKTRLVSDLDQTQNVFMWQNNLLKFYMEYNIPKACDYSDELLDEVENILTPEDLGDLYFSAATSLILSGDSERYDRAHKILDHCVEGTALEQNRGYIYNNIGMLHFYKCVQQTQELGAPQNVGASAMKPVFDNYFNAVKNLKKSVCAFEDFEGRFGNLEADPSSMPQDVKDSIDTDEQTMISMQKIKSKLFVEDCFIPKELNLEEESGKKLLQIFPEDFKKHYDILQRIGCDRLLESTF